MDLAIECDSHVVKRTWPLRPSTGPGSEMGFIRDDAFGTTFIGEGCWGAPLRRNDDDKSWTRASGSFNQINWICVTPEKMFSRTVMVDKSADGDTIDPENPFELPDGMEIWEPDSGAVVTVLPRGEEGRPAIYPLSIARLTIVGKKKFADSNEIRIEVAGGLDLGDAEIRYTLDGNAPAAGSTLYAAPFQIDTSTTVTAAIFREGKALTESVQATFKKSGS